MATIDPRVTLITGANKGIGRAVAEALARDAKTVVYIGARDEASAKRAADELSDTLADVRSVRLDVTEAGSIALAVRRVRADFGRLDVLVNNAGVAFDAGPPSQTPLDVVRDTYAVNVFGVIAMTQA